MFSVGNIFVDRTLQIVLYGVGCGMSGSWWRNQHNKHHAMPQKLGHDVDLNTLPLVAFTEKVAKKMGMTQKLWIKSQGYMFPVLTTTLVTLGWQFYLHPQHVLRTKNYGEAAALMTRLILWSVFITGHFGLLQSAVLYMAYNWIASNYIFINFAVSHTHLPVVEKADTQVNTTEAFLTKFVLTAAYTFHSCHYSSFLIFSSIYPPRCNNFSVNSLSLSPLRLIG